MSLDHSAQPLGREAFSYEREITTLIRALDARAWRGVSGNPQLLEDVAQIREILVRSQSQDALLTPADLRALQMMVRRHDDQAQRDETQYERAVANAARLAATLIPWPCGAGAAGARALSVA